ncbi:ArsR family transcriptional regulator [Acinetobacter sp. ANC 4635]|uniref:ArsR family transcriptional regulator n=1 Tax=Acinetobacter sp. ANC 4635 TaxID=2529846 RepID=UPI00103BAC98|nr:ArsR family transcriptional regulator [Acinetobacter sp. ANC 4635]
MQICERKIYQADKVIRELEGEDCAYELLQNLATMQSTLSHHMKCLTESVWSM